MQLRIPHRKSRVGLRTDRPAEYYISLIDHPTHAPSRRVLLTNRSRDQAIEVTLKISQGTDQSWGKIQLRPREHRRLYAMIAGGGPKTPVIIYHYDVLGASFVND